VVQIVNYNQVNKGNISNQTFNLEKYIRNTIQIKTFKYLSHRRTMMSRESNR